MSERSVSPPTDWLAPLSPGQVKTQAINTVKAAYAPAFNNLTGQQKQAQGISDKRTTDNRYYQTWLSTQQDALQAHADAANKQLSDQIKGIGDQQNALYAGQAPALIAGANARAGNVSNNAQSTAFGTNLQQNQQYNQGLQQDASKQALEGILTNQNMGHAAAANNYNLVSAMQSKQLSELDSVISKISDARLKLTGAQTDATTKEISRLQGVEINKANSNRNYNAAVSKLQLAGALASSTISTRAANTRIAQQNADTNLTRAQLGQMNADRNYQLNKDKFDSATAKDLYLRDHGLGSYRVATGHGQKPALGAGAQNTIFGHLANLSSTIDKLAAQHGGGDAGAKQAWQDVHNGYYMGKDKKGNPIKVFLKGPGIGGGHDNDALLNAAYNTRSGAGGLSPGDVAYLHGLGLHIGSRLQIVPNYNSSQSYQGRT